MSWKAAARSPSPLQVLITGFLGLLVAIGIGRFALTPQLPLMIQAGQLSLTGASLVAASNYLGYLAGSLDAMRARRHSLARLRLGLWLCVACPLLSAWADSVLLHALLRFVAGVASAWVLILLTSWTQQELARQGRLRLAGGIFTGPAVGIVLVGLAALVIGQASAWPGAGWLVYGALALGMVLYLQRQLPQALPSRGEGAPAALPRSAALYRLAAVYGLAGFGYILPATFLSQLARGLYPQGAVADVFWPLFGLAALVGVLASARQSHAGGASWRLAVGLWLQAAGVLACVLLPGVWGLGLGAVLVGVTFMAIVQSAIQAGRELTPQHPQQVAGLLTTSYAVGQLAGPLLAALSTHGQGSLAPALLLAALALLVAGALVYPRTATLAVASFPGNSNSNSNSASPAD